MKFSRFLSLIALTFALGSLPAVVQGEDAGAPAQPPVTIMPLGDSITEGSRTYRYPLMQRLVDAGYRVQYVGSKTTGAVAGSPLGVLANEGHSGKTIQFLADNMESFYRQNPADVVLLHAGHNQFADKKPVPNMIVATRQIIAAARSINPHVTILLGQVITSGKLPKYSYIPELNEQLASLAGELNTKEQPVIIVNHAEGWQWETDTVKDMVHPSQAGADKMAEKWFQALVKILPPPAK